jgi:hypothetical protein
MWSVGSERMHGIWRRGDTQKNTHNIQHTAKVWNQVLSSYFVVTIHNKWVIRHACLINHAEAYNPKFRNTNNILAFRNRHTGFLISQIRKINSDCYSTYKIKVYTHQNVTSLTTHSNHFAYRCVSVQVKKLIFNSLITGVHNLSKKSISRLKILAARKMTWSKFHPQRPQILDATIQNSPRRPQARDLHTSGPVRRIRWLHFLHRKLWLYLRDPNTGEDIESCGFLRAW